MLAVDHLGGVIKRNGTGILCHIILHNSQSILLRYSNNLMIRATGFYAWVIRENAIFTALFPISLSVFIKFFFATTHMYISVVLIVRCLVAYVFTLC